MIYSFDVFDTLITRTTASPLGIFALMQERLQRERAENGLEDYVIDNFYELRRHGETLIRKSGYFQRKEEVTLEEIYQAVSVCGCLKEDQIEYLCRMEEELEIANVRGIPANIRRLKGLLERGERVILVSDMYLSPDIIRKMLLQANAALAELPLYVSSAYGRRKTTGNLYRTVQQAEGVSFSDWVHIGDNLHQDIEVPYSLGIQVEWWKRPELSKLEAELVEARGDDGRLQLMIGTALGVLREMGEAGAGKENGAAGEVTEDEGSNEAGEAEEAGRSGEVADAYEIGCRYAGPVLYSYGEWIVDQAVKKGIKRLYFIARDGYLVKKIVDVILKKEGTDIKTQYIYGSRKAWRMASLSKDHYNLYQLILWSHVLKIKTLWDLAGVLHVPLEKLYDFLPGVYKKRRQNENISNQELEYIVKRLSQDDVFREFHLKQLEGERSLAVRYLTQEVDMSDDDFAFVDVSGGGLSQGCLKELIKDQYPKSIRTFFFKIDRVNLVKNSLTDTFMPGFLENNLVIEMMCRAPHGQTCGYELKGGKAVPVLEDTESRGLMRHGFADYERGILDFAGRMKDICRERGIRIASMRNVLSYLEHIAGKPSKQVLEYFASMPSNETGRGTQAVEYAPRLTEEEIRQLFLVRTSEPVEVFYKGTDLNYSVMRASESERELIQQCKKEHGKILGRLARQKKEREDKALRERWGRAAFYPVRLLEERVVIYGAGKFGQDLYRRLSGDPEHQVALWADKNAAACRRQGLECVRESADIGSVLYDQIVIAVMDEETALEIRRELEGQGIAPEKIIWLKPYQQRNWLTEWYVKGIG